MFVAGVVGDDAVLARGELVGPPINSDKHGLARKKTIMPRRRNLGVIWRLLRRDCGGNGGAPARRVDGALLLLESHPIEWRTVPIMKRLSVGFLSGGMGFVDVGDDLPTQSPEIIDVLLKGRLWW